MLFSCTPEDNSQNGQENLVVTGEALDVTDCSATLTGYANLPLEFGNAEVGIMYDSKLNFEGGQSVAATVLDGNNKFTVTVTGLEAATTYYYKSYVKNGMAVQYGAVKSFTTQECQMVVDLGLSVLWAVSNLSETGLCPNPYDYGAYYAWGETETKEKYSWETYKFGTSTYGPLSKYNTSSSYGTVDNKTVLDPEDDVAHVKLGDNWRVPTYAEWKELRNNCTWTWTDNYNGTGIAGRIVTSNVEGYKDKSIFLPVAGYRLDADLYGAGSLGGYWSSSLNTDYPSYAWYVYFDSSDVDGYRGYRYDGFSVRPVSE